MKSVAKIFLASPKKHPTSSTIRKNNEIIFQIGGKYPSIADKFTEAAEFLKSPMFFIQLVFFAMGNCMITLTINIANDILGKLSPRDLEGSRQKHWNDDYFLYRFRENDFVERFCCALVRQSTYF